MNISARISKAEKALGQIAGGDPKRIEALLRYLQTGDPADIPPDVKAPELQAAARRIPREAEATLKGLGIIRDALGDKLPAGESVLERIATNPLCVRESRVKDDEKPPADPQAGLMARLGFTVIQLTVVITSKAGAISE